MPASEAPKSETPPTAIPDGIVEVVTCPECSETFESADDAETEPKYECGNCGEAFPASEGESRGWAQNGCPSCGKYASNVGRCHAGCGGDVDEFEAGFKCDECDETFDDLPSAVKHLTDHAEPDVPPLPQGDDGPLVPSPFRVTEVRPDGSETVTTGSVPAHAPKRRRVPGCGGAYDTPRAEPTYQFQTRADRVKVEGDGTVLVRVDLPLIAEMGSRINEEVGLASDYLLPSQAVRLAVRLLRATLMTTGEQDQADRDLATVLLREADRLNLLDDAEVDV